MAKQKSSQGRKRSTPTVHSVARGDGLAIETVAKNLLPFLEERREDLVATVRELVQIESPSDCKPACDRIGQWIANRFIGLGGRVKLHRSGEFGDHLQVDFPGQKGNPILLLGHIDTVYPMGTLASMPCKVTAGKLYGPGAFDMKSGIALMVHALGAWASQRTQLPRPVTVLLVSDEEVGSPSSRAITEALARNCGAVLVLEPAAGTRGAVKTARKGVGEYKLRVTGVSAHAGLDPGKGHSAILEMARQIERISAFTDMNRGLTVNVGVVHGGTRTNVVAAEAVAEIDVRISSSRDADFITRKLKSLKPVNRNCRVEVFGEINRFPMERTKGVALLYERARTIAAGLGWKLDEAAVGGGSDGNFTAALGIPTLDGLGGVGEGAHAVHESIVIEELPRRAALLAGLIASFDGVAPPRQNEFLTTIGA
jgi:glutamate carboxypeptidase